MKSKLELIYPTIKEGYVSILGIVVELNFLLKMTKFFYQRRQRKHTLVLTFTFLQFRPNLNSFTYESESRASYSYLQAKGARNVFCDVRIKPLSIVIFLHYFLKPISGSE